MGHSPEAWDAAFRAHGDGSARDANAHAAGRFFFDRLRRLRKEIGEIEQHIAARDPAEALDRIASMTTLVWIQLGREDLQTPPNEGFTALEHLATRRRSDDAQSTGYTLTERVEATIDALRFPLRVYLTAKAFGAVRPKLPELSFRQGLTSFIVMAQLYSMYERAWEQVLWFDATLSIRRNGTYTLSDADGVLAKEAAQDLARRAFSFQRDILRLSSDDEGSGSSDQRYLLLDDAGALSVAPLSAMPDEVRERINDVCLHRSVLLDGELNHVLGRGKLAGTGVTIGDAMRVHLHLAVVATQIAGKALNPNGPTNEAVLDLRFSVDALSTSVSECAQVSPEDVRAVIDVLTFKGKDTDDLWRMPLIPTHRGVAMAAPALVTGDLKRLIAYWSKEDSDLHPEHAVRGHAFAKQVNNVLKQLASRTRLLEPVLVAGPNILIPGGDIDCLLVCGDMAFVLECRVCPHAASPYEHWSVDEYLREKVDQVSGQVAYVRQYPEEIRRLTGIDVPLKRVVGVVVTNSYMREGTVCDGVYFAHVDTLAHLIGYGGLLFGAMGPHLTGQTLRARAIGMPASDALHDAIRRGDKASFYRSRLGLARNPMASFAGGGSPGEVHSWVVAFPPIGEMWDALHQMPFSSHLEVVDGEQFNRV